MSAAIGRPLDRVDGPAKVTGQARYSAEIVLPGMMSYAALVGARVASGRVARIDAGAALAADGVLAVLTHENLPPIATAASLGISLAGGPAAGQSFFPLQDDAVHYAGQPVAIVVADSHERAHYAASLLDVAYEELASRTTLSQPGGEVYEPQRIFGGFMPGRSERGDADAGLAAADRRLDVTFRLAANHHNPIEPSATTAVWDGDELTLYDSTMGVRATQLTVAQLLGISPSKVRVVTHFVGGGFGCKALIWPHVTLAALAAREVGRPVKLVLTRPQMFTSVGHREEQRQRIELGAAADGRLVALRHDKLAITSPFDDWAEPSLGGSAHAYACPNYTGVYRLVHANTMTATFTRGPGLSTGAFAMECALDELAHDLGIDPIELRLRNHTAVDAETGHAWTSDGLRACYARGAELFGWERRDPTPGVRRDGDWLIGTGMAAAPYPIAFPMQVQRARARVYADGSIVVQTGTQEFGTGVATAMTQVAADALGVDVEAVRVEIGDTDLPNTSPAVGSAGAGMISAAVHLAGIALRDQLVAWAVGDERSPLSGADPRDVVVVGGGGGRMVLRESPGVGESYAQLLQRNFQADAEAVGSWTPPPPDTPHGLMTFGAQFAEVAVDADLGLVRARRLTGVFAPGRVLNAKTARSQLMGGMLWGLGQALLEGNQMDPQAGRWAAESLGDYLVPVNADAPDVQVEMVELADDVVNPLGVKGVGEIGQVGVAAAIANAVFHATGTRVRELPITVEQLLPSARAPAAARASRA